jgi:NDP-sugar pyrophosphorylase family protein
MLCTFQREAENIETREIIEEENEQRYQQIGNNQDVEDDVDEDQVVICEKCDKCDFASVRKKIIDNHKG